MRALFPIAAVVAGALCIATADDTRAAPAIAASHFAPPTALVTRVASVCGGNGCSAVQTKKVVHQRPGSVGAKHI
jgi:hypothetical protein